MKWTLPADELHVWRASLEREPHVVAAMRGVLSEKERSRADRFRFERGRSRFIVGRALLRELLARYVGCAAREVAFRYGEFEKPMLAGGPSDTRTGGSSDTPTDGPADTQTEGPWFNLSHSGSVALYAFSAVGEVGIDVELYDPSFARERIAERFFSAAEVKALRSLPLEDQPWAFLSCWTRKEAFIKARGDGLSLALDSFDVTLEPDVPAALLRTAWCPDEAKRWRIEDLSDRKAGYVAAVAVRDDGWRVVERDAAQLLDTIEGGQAA